jgi:hypothetical protein
MVVNLCTRWWLAKNVSSEEDVIQLQKTQDGDPGQSIQDDELGPVS